MRARLLPALALLLVVAPVALLAWLRLHTEDRLAEVTIYAPAVEATAAARLDASPQPVVVALEWQDPVTAPAPAWRGLVTEVPLQAGTAVREGDVVVVIDGVARVAAPTPRPFHRALRRGDAGSDVVMLQELMARLGHLDPAVATDGTYGSATSAAVRSFAEAAGVAKPDGSFDPGLVAWLPSDPFVVATTTALVGRPAPAAGDPWLAGPSSIGAATVLDAAGDPTSLPGEWELEAGGEVVPLRDGVLGTDALAALAGATAAGEKTVDGRVRRADPLEVVDVPAAAVVAGDDGALCVFVRTPDGHAPRRVEVASGGPGTAAVVAGLTPGETVLANPGDALRAPACP